MHFNEILVKNNNFRKDISPVFSNNTTTVIEVEKGSLMDKLYKNSKDIMEKRFGDISSFNFKRDVFFSNKWTEISKIARGLFLNNQTGNIIARGYDKFFNYKEGNFNNDEFLKNNLKYPVIAYKKYNGFFGVLGIHNDEFIFCSKSCIDSAYSNYFKNIFMKDDHNNEYLKRFMMDNHICLVFEVIDHINDPHIVEYNEDKLILLDVVFLEESFKNMHYETIQRIGKDCNFFVKEIEKTFNNYNELNNFIKIEEESMETQKEGYVFVDENNYHFKLKCKWYKTWKFMRSLKDRIAKNKSFSTSGLNLPIYNYFYGWCKKQNLNHISDSDIITLRKEFCKEFNQFQ